MLFIVPTAFIRSGVEKMRLYWGREVKEQMWACTVRVASSLPAEQKLLKRTNLDDLFSVEEIMAYR
jgi:hypothetical protein